jgi:hypothetical protein
MTDFVSIYKDLIVKYPFPPEEKTDDGLTVAKINAAFKQIEETYGDGVHSFQCKG